jgi:hypothetical protein
LLDRNSWLDLYNYAAAAWRSEQRAELTLLATAIVFTGALRGTELVLALMTVAGNWSSFEHLAPPPHAAYADVYEREPVLSVLRAAFQAQASSLRRI